MLLLQVRYISGWVWVTSVLVFAGIFLTSRVLEPKLIALVFSLTPFLVLISVTESVRSITCGMDELEMAARFSVKSVMMAKMGILGMENILILALAAVVLPQNFWENALYLLGPYMLTALGNLAIVRRWRGKDATYACAGLAAFVCVGGITITSCYPVIYEAKYQKLWCLVLLLLIGMTIWESYKMIQKTEELAWN